MFGLIHWDRIGDPFFFGGRERREERGRRETQDGAHIRNGWKSHKREMNRKVKINIEGKVVHVWSIFEAIFLCRFLCVCPCITGPPLWPLFPVSNVSHQRKKEKKKHGIITKRRRHQSVRMRAYLTQLGKRVRVGLSIYSHMSYCSLGEHTHTDVSSEWPPWTR
ncbi:hypothetical protein CI102_14619 [Trichoderma harzianum]|nr:hypothetical protein CI102_14619 [Trichoderma harzianum]